MQAFTMSGYSHQGQHHRHQQQPQSQSEKLRVADERSGYNDPKSSPHQLAIPGPLAAAEAERAGSEATANQAGGDGDRNYHHRGSPSAQQPFPTYSNNERYQNHHHNDGGRLHPSPHQQQHLEQQQGGEQQQRQVFNDESEEEKHRHLQVFQETSQQLEREEEEREARLLSLRNLTPEEYLQQTGVSNAMEDALGLVVGLRPYNPLVLFSDM